MKKFTLIAFVNLFFLLSINCQAQISVTSDSNSKIFHGEHEDYIIGELTDAKLQDEQVYVVDQAGTKVLMLSDDGELIQHVGRSGRGPGEYEGPISLDFVDEELLILDQSLNRINRYILESGEWMSDNSGSFDLNMSDMCVSEGDIFVHSFSEENIIHQIDRDLKSITHSFGNGYETDEHAIQQEISADGRLACGEQFIYSGFTLDNKIKIYDKNDATIKHQIKFDEIVPAELSTFERDGNVAISRSYYPGEGYDERGDFNDSLKNLLIANELLIVQYVRSFSDAESDKQFIISFIVDPIDGTYQVDKDLPLLFDQNSDHLLFGSNYPVPYIEIGPVNN